MKNKINKVVGLIFSFLILGSCEKVTLNSMGGIPASSVAGTVVTSISIDAQGNEWFGTNAGASYFDGNNWTTYLSGIIINSVTVDAQNNIWFGTYEHGAYKFDWSEWINYNTESGLVNNDVDCITTDRKGNIWFGTNEGISEFNGSTWNSFFAQTYGINTILIDPKGNKWFGTGDDGVLKYDGNNWITYSSNESGLVNDIINIISSDAKENLWVGTANGVSVFDGTKWETFAMTNGLADNTVRCIAFDPQGNKWFGTANGISVFDGTNWKTYNSNNGLTSNYVFSVAIDSHGNKWFGTTNGVSKFDGTNWTTYKGLVHPDYAL